MRVAIIAPLEMRVPPVGYGGTELVVSLLSEELQRRGHDVTLFASGDSITSCRLQSVCDRFLRGTSADRYILNMLNVVSCLQQAEDFDVIHNHTAFEGMSTAGLVSTPMLTTLHGHLKGDWLTLFQHYRGWYNTISHSARRLLPEREGFAGVIYNAIDVSTYPFQQRGREDYLLFLSRISWEKGPHVAIAVARLLKRRLIIAGNVHPNDESYFQTKVLPHIDGDQIQYVGEADAERKRELMSSASCLLAPILWAEPFGLFMAEAMACGTPVVAFRRGAAPELIVDGLTGYLVNDLPQMAESVRRIDRLDPERCRRHVAENFNIARMADDYLAAYDRILTQSRFRSASTMLAA